MATIAFMNDNTILDPVLLAEALNASRCGIALTDARQPDNPIIFVNAAFTEITGYSAAEALGRNCRFLQESVHGAAEGNTEALQKISRAIKTGVSVTAELRNFRKDGAPFWNELSLSPIRNAIGELTHFIGVQMDISARKEAELEMERVGRGLTKRVGSRTAELKDKSERLYQEIIEHKKTERALRIAEKKYRSIFENAIEGIYQSTPDGKYLAVNPSMARMYGYDSPRHLIDTVRDISEDVYIDPTSRLQFKRAIEQDGLVKNLESQMRRRDGSTIWIAEHARVVRDARGTVLYYEGTVQDITGRKTAEAEAAKLEAQLRQTQKLEAIGTLAGGIAHDFNNVLAAIMGYAQLIELDVPSGTPAFSHLQRVLSACDRGRELIHQILSFSRNSAPERRKIRLSMILREALKLLRATLPSTIEIQQNILTDEDWTFADAIQIHQVLMNLATNASHAMRDTGGILTVTLETEDTFADLVANADSAQKFLRLTVTDTGHGIPSHLLNRIFEPFFTTKPAGEGTGLGLSVVHGIIRDHGGSITVESKSGYGTTFTVLLPRAQQDARSEATQILQIHRGNGQRILVVDDEEAIVSMLEDMLTRLNYKPIGVTRSLEALKILESDPHAIDLLFTDQTMPDLTGLDLATALAGWDHRPPIIICTGYAHSISNEKALQNHVHAIVQKPIKLAELSRVISEALSSKILTST